MVDLYHCHGVILRAPISMLSFNNNKPCSLIHDLVHFLQSNSHVQTTKGILVSVLYRIRNINTCLSISARNTNF